ncbi:MurR/RpiR family transcriptional regulator [Clostridium gasigenes]|uniref:MurR/RpiR family transcriptional regulator n=1 Tax=Clostridium gasigenes TaxID=94869 RepID=UPI00143857EA|nr:MurR/RpiR family transcriptional regulator [Clostridium gasigenes]MBU3104638.1 MurR/RpiR family transcriptional regulator [Clostridium gasigenes]MBU3133764.1 MurR/RpiR family transcriptional regulator [Clostridium gasigenes]MBU3136853.1 MurR/RpiR family transcriptional regulator [Clostridium gasigenes]NKF06517.1 MurR/RpiR family transcriptional regulator [Clostridium gasigenes]QSW21124.1 MurR/RpiR family transcriptional regulator [Clostridium gasigenes]
MFNYEIIQSLNHLELSVYDYIMKNSKKVMYMRIRELADEAHVSTTTILRFCKKLKCEGFSEFKVKFKMYIEEENIEKISDDTSEIINFLKTIENSDLDKRLDELCDLVKVASNIIFIGIGSSGILCKYAARYFSSIGKFTVHIDDPFYPTNFKHYDNCLIIALSVSGETPTTIDNIVRLKREGCSIVSITNSENCSISKMSDLNLSYYVQQVKVGYSDITTQLPVLYMIERIGKKLYNEYRIE